MCFVCSQAFSRMNGSTRETLDLSPQDQAVNSLKACWLQGGHRDYGTNDEKGKVGAKGRINVWKRLSHIAWNISLVKDT